MSTLLAGLHDLLKKNKAEVIKHKQCKLVLSADQHHLPVEKISSSAVKVIKRLKNAGFEAYLVGGGVRDLLLGKEPKDFDVSTNATPEQVAHLFNSARIIGRRFKIVHILFGDDIIEVTTFRGGNKAPPVKVNAPVKSNSRRYEVQVSESGMLVRDNSYGKRIEDDAARRDFTINAIYFDVQTGELIDFHGGLYDLTQNIIDIIGDPETRYREDPVRILRAARFSAKLGFKISKRTFEKIEPCADQLSLVSNARMYDEVNKLFLTGHAKASFKVLLALNLFDRLFNLAPVTINSGSCKDFLYNAFESTDQRFRENKRNMPHFLYAVVLWNEFIWLLFYARNRMMLSSGQCDYNDMIHGAIMDTLMGQYPVTALPEQVINSITHMWHMQFLLESHHPEDKIDNVTKRAAFRAAYDLLKIRSMSSPDLDPIVEFWTPFYEKIKSNAERRRAEEARRRESRRHGRNSYDAGRESDAENRSRINRAKAWRESMNLEP